MPQPPIARRKSAVLDKDVVATDITAGVLSEVNLPAGTEVFLEIGSLEWLGREGMYSEISVSGQPGRRYRVRQFQLARASRELDTSRTRYS